MANVAINDLPKQSSVLDAKAMSTIRGGTTPTVIPFVSPPLPVPFVPIPLPNWNSYQKSKEKKLRMTPLRALLWPA